MLCYAYIVLPTTQGPDIGTYNYYNCSDRYYSLYRKY